jgi:uncharacterized protein DUF488
VIQARHCVKTHREEEPEGGRDGTSDVTQDGADAAGAHRVRGPRLLTVGHGTTGCDELARLLRGAGVELVVDVRSTPGSRRFPQFRRAELAEWLPAAGIGYRWEPGLGGFRRPAPGSPHAGLRHPSFRAYADYMATDPFRQALARVIGKHRAR